MALINSVDMLSARKAGGFRYQVAIEKWIRELPAGTPSASVARPGTTEPAVAVKTVEASVPASTKPTTPKQTPIGDFLHWPLAAEAAAAKITPLNRSSFRERAHLLVKNCYSCH